MPDWQRLLRELARWQTSQAIPLPPELPARATCSPRDVEQLQELLRLAYAEELPVYPVGGGTAWNFGRNPTAEGIALFTTGLQRIEDYPARDMTITVEAGITMSRLTQTLATEQQRLPVNASESEQATLGGVIATNASGPHRYGYGTLRDYVIGISAVDAEGTLFKAGGRVVKNVAGYDLCKLLIGSLGTLAIITQVTLKVRPVPEATALVWSAWGDDLISVNAVLGRLVTSATRPVCIDLLNEPAADWVAQAAGEALPVHGYALVVGFEGSAEAVRWQQQTLLGELQAPAQHVATWCGAAAVPFWGALTEFAAAPAQLTFKANLPSSAVAAFYQSCAGRGLALQSHAGNGIVIAKHNDVQTAAAVEALLQPLRDAARASGGNLVVLRCPAAWKEHLAVWGAPREDAGLMRAIKRKFDPKGLLNPGRFLEGT